MPREQRQAEVRGGGTYSTLACHEEQSTSILNKLSVYCLYQRPCKNMGAKNILETLLDDDDRRRKPIPLEIVGKI